MLKHKSNQGTLKLGYLTVRVFRVHGRQQLHGRESGIFNAYVSNSYNQLDSPARRLKELTPHTKDKRAHN